MFNTDHCSPAKNTSKHSCLTLKLLRRVARSLNKYNGSTIKLNNTKKKLHDDISKEINKISNCQHEKCWITINIIKSELNPEEIKLFKESFIPNMPKEWNNKPNTWLSTKDINSVMSQYENAYPRFKYMGAIPIDFNNYIGNKCVSEELCNIDIQKLQKEKKDSIGIVFNTDPHNKSGEHWFSIYIDIKGRNRKGVPCIYYFDSLADPPEKEIMELVEKITKQCRSFNKDIDFLYNDKVHQNGNTECGVYSMNFIIRLLHGETFDYIVQNVTKDEAMNACRGAYFRNQ